MKYGISGTKERPSKWKFVILLGGKSCFWRSNYRDERNDMLQRETNNIV